MAFPCLSARSVAVCLLLCWAPLLASAQVNLPPISVPNITNLIPPISIPNITNLIPPISIPNITNLIPPISGSNITQYIPPGALSNITQYIPPGILGGGGSPPASPPPPLGSPVSAVMPSSAMALAIASLTWAILGVA